MLSSYMRGLLTRACITDSIAAMFKIRRMMRMIEQKTVTCILFLLTRPLLGCKEKDLLCTGGLIERIMA